MIRPRRPLVFAEEVFEEFHITASQNDLNLATAVFTTAAKPFVAGQNWHVIIDSGVTIGCSTKAAQATSGTANVALTTGVFPRVLKLTIRGAVQGSGGDGGQGGIEFGVKDGGLGGGGGGGSGVIAGAGGDGSAPATDGDAGTAANVRADGGFGNIEFTQQPERTERLGGGGGTAISMSQDMRLVIDPGGKLWAGGGGGGGASGLGIQLLTTRGGGYGGAAGAAGGQGGDGTHDRYSSSGSGAGGGLQGIAIITHSYNLTILSPAGDGGILGLVT